MLPSRGLAVTVEAVAVDDFAFTDERLVEVIGKVVGERSLVSALEGNPHLKRTTWPHAGWGRVVTKRSVSTSKSMVPVTLGSLSSFHSRPALSALGPGQNSDEVTRTASSSPSRVGGPSGGVLGPSGSPIP